MNTPDRAGPCGGRPGGGQRPASSRDLAPPELDALWERGHIADIDRHFGRLAAELDGRGQPEVALAAALASERTRHGHPCLVLAEAAGRDWPPAGAGAMRLPDLAPWIEAVETSPIVARPGDAEQRPLVLDRQGRLYLARFWTAEQAVAAQLRRLADGADHEPDALEAALDRLFPDAAPDERPRAAARTALQRRLCVVSGGPGTGKTTIVAAIVALLIELGLAAPGRVALAAPTGKAAARLQAAVRGRLRALATAAPATAGYEAEATTVHRLLLRRGGREGLAVDALVVDEGSMVDLSLMARVLAEVPDGARLVVLGDASQLASVAPGSVFADLCRAGAEPSSPLFPSMIELVHNWRFDERGGIGRLAAAVVQGDACGALAALADPSDSETGLRPLPDAGAFERLASQLADERFAPMLRKMQALREPEGEAGTGLSASFRVLCAHRTGPFGSERFNRCVERRLRALGLVRARDDFYAGRPILVTRNDPQTRLSNGDTGVVLHAAAGWPLVWFPELQEAGGGPRLVSPARLPPHEVCFAMTVHRAQGSEYDEVAVVPGPAASRVASRELLYTALTRARRRVVVYGARDSVAAAIEQATLRSSGLREALAQPARPG